MSQDHDLVKRLARQEAIIERLVGERTTCSENLRNARKEMKSLMGEVAAVAAGQTDLFRASDDDYEVDGEAAHSRSGNGDMTAAVSRKAKTKVPRG